MKLKCFNSLADLSDYHYCLGALRFNSKVSLDIMSLFYLVRLPKLVFSTSRFLVTLVELYLCKDYKINKVNETCNTCSQIKHRSKCLKGIIRRDISKYF